MLLAAIAALAAGVVDASEAAFVPPAFRSLRYDEDYSYLGDRALRRGPLDEIKFVALDAKRDAYLTLGGEIRERYELVRHSSWGRGPQDEDGYLLQRFMLHADLHFSESWRLFAQLKSGLESGRSGGPRATDEDELDLHQAFIEGPLLQSRDGEVRLRAGRQELDYGSSRLISAREGPNVRLAFDGLKLMTHYADWHADAFAVRPVQTLAGKWDDASSARQSLWGVYAVGPASWSGGFVDVYYLGLHRQSATFEQGSAREQRHSLGIRLWRRHSDWDHNLELVYQFGAFGRSAIRAWTAASDVGFTFSASAGRPRVGLKTDVTSGDRDPRSSTLQTFDPLFPRGAYFGEPALIGPANHVDVHPSLTLKPARGVTVELSWIGFWRQSRGDGLYGPGVNLLVAGDRAQSRTVGQQIELKTEWAVGRHLSFTADVARFLAGRFLDEATPGTDIDYASVWGTFRF